MNDLNDFVERYVAVWNEPDSARRRERIAALWTPSGASLHRVLEPRGHAAIEARVAASYDKWVHGRGCTFRSARHAFGHHDAVMCNWEMVSPQGTVISLGLSFLILDPYGLVHTELQFSEPPSAPLPEHEALVEHLVAMWNEPDAQARRIRIDTLWQADGAHVNSERTLRRARGDRSRGRTRLRDVWRARPALSLPGAHRRPPRRGAHGLGAAGRRRRVGAGAPAPTCCCSAPTAACSATCSSTHRPSG